jgi:hypothetical protein
MDERQARMDRPSRRHGRIRCEPHAAPHEVGACPRGPASTFRTSCADGRSSGISPTDRMCGG